MTGSHLVSRVGAARSTLPSRWVVWIQTMGISLSRLIPPLVRILARGARAAGVRPSEALRWHAPTSIDLLWSAVGGMHVLPCELDMGGHRLA